MEFSKGEIRRWWADAITQNMFSRIEDVMDGMDVEVHSLLQGVGDEHLKAAFLNARMQQLKEVLEIKNDMLDEAEGE